MAESQQTAAPPPPRRRDPKAATNEATPGKPGELTAAAKAALAAASRDREAAPPRLSGRAQVDAVAALIEGGSTEQDAGDDGERQQRQPERRRRGSNGAAGGAEIAGDDESEGVGEAEARRRRGDDEGDAGEDDGADGEDDAHGDDDSVTLDDLARHAGLTAQEINKLPVRIGPDTLTLGELKARLPDLAKLDASRAEFEERRELAELEIIDAHRRVRAIVDAFPANSIPPQVMRRLDAAHQEAIARESDMLHRARPQWRDTKYATAERESMAKMGARYGFSTAELASSVDHRQVLLLQDFAHALARIDAAKAAARQVEPGSDKRPARETARAAGTDQHRPRGMSRKQDVSARVARLIAQG